jgi:hypothetical protein
MYIYWMKTRQTTDMNGLNNVSRTARNAMKCSPQVGLDFGTGMK